MAVQAKNYLDYAGLSKYDELIKAYIGTGDAKAIKTVLWDSTAEQIKFYKKENATLSDTADYAITISSSDVAALKTRVGMSDTLNSYNDATNLTSIMNILTGSASTAGSVAKALADAEAYTDAKVATLDADVDASGTAAHGGTFVVSGITEVDGKITAVDSVEVEAAGAAAAAVADLDVDEFALASVSNNVVTIKGIKEVDGEIAVGTDSTKNVVLEEVAITGAADDVSTTAITDGAAEPSTLYPAGTVQGTLQSIARDLNSLESGSVVTISKDTSATGLAAKYTISQGGVALGTTIDIPKDMVVSDGVVVDVVFVAADSSLHEGSASGTDVTEEIKGTGTATAADAGKYIKLTIANSAKSHLWIKATDLVDVYTVEADADEVQLAISNNEISASIVDVSGTKITYIAADATTEPAVARESVTQALTRLDGADSVDGSVAKKIKTAIQGLDTSSDVAVASYAAGTSGAADVITLTGSVAEADGIIEAGSADTITLSNITTAQINSLFS